MGQNSWPFVAMLAVFGLLIAGYYLLLAIGGEAARLWLVEAWQSTVKSIGRTWPPAFSRYCHLARTSSSGRPSAWVGWIMGGRVIYGSCFTAYCLVCQPLLDLLASCTGPCSGVYSENCLLNPVWRSLKILRRTCLERALILRLTPGVPAYFRKLWDRAFYRNEIFLYLTISLPYPCFYCLRRTCICRYIWRGMEIFPDWCINHCSYDFIRPICSKKEGNNAD